MVMGKKISQTRSRAMCQSWIRRREAGIASTRKAKNGKLAAAVATTEGDK